MKRKRPFFYHFCPLTTRCWTWLFVRLSSICGQSNCTNFCGFALISLNWIFLLRCGTSLSDLFATIIFQRLNTENKMFWCFYMHTETHTATEWRVSSADWSSICFELFKFCFWLPWPGKIDFIVIETWSLFPIWNPKSPFYHAFKHNKTFSNHSIKIQRRTFPSRNNSHSTSDCKVLHLRISKIVKSRHVASKYKETAVAWPVSAHRWLGRIGGSAEKGRQQLWAGELMRNSRHFSAKRIECPRKGEIDIWLGLSLIPSKSPGEWWRNCVIDQKCFLAFSHAPQLVAKIIVDW